MAGPRRRRRDCEAPMSQTERIGAVFAARRLVLGLTQQALADLAGTSRSTVQALEHGTGSVKLALLVDIAEVLGLHIDATTSP